MKDLAPIGVSAYVRLEHLKQTLGALKNNFLAEESELYVFSDAPREGDERNVQALRTYAATISGFKSVTVIEREQNNRVYNNRGGIDFLLNKYKKVIWLEEDIITSQYFLKYMNDALIAYKDNDKIISITGYCPPIRIPDSYDKDVFLLKRFNAWGFGVWKHKFEPFSYSIDKDEYNRLLSSTKPVLDRYGKDIFGMVEKEANNELDALDVKLMYFQAVHDLYTVYPVRSMVKNIGFDGSGLHCGNTGRFDVELSNSKIKINHLDKENKFIIRENRKFRNESGIYFFYKMINKLKKLFDG